MSAVHTTSGAGFAFPALAVWPQDVVMMCGKARMIGVTAAQVAVVVLLGVALTLPHLPQRTCRYAGAVSTDAGVVL